ncbi:hypothetical protein NKH77_25065 [Streptomyces sp. M19]
MLGRHSLTSNAARARSDVLDAMLTRSGEQYLGFDATAGRYGPERAIYSGALAYLGLHRANGTIQAENSPTACCRTASPLQARATSTPSPSGRRCRRRWTQQPGVPASTTSSGS